MTTSMCPRWEGCSVPICPLDPNWERRIMTRDDPVCFYLIEASKIDSEANFRGVGREDLYRLISDVLPTIYSRFLRIRRVLFNASKTGSRIARMKNLEVSHV